MKTLAIIGSSRKSGNTETLVRQALLGAGGDAKVYVLAEMSIHGCQGCQGCRLEGSDGCILTDEMQELYGEIKSADTIVLGSPIYYGEVTGQMKCFMDRWYALRDKDRNLRIGAGKKALFIFVQGAKDEGRYSGCVNRVLKVLEGYEMEPSVLVASGLEKKGAAGRRPELLRQAFDAGRRLASGH